MEQIFPKDYVTFLQNNNFTCNLRESENFVKSQYYNMDSTLNYTNMDCLFPDIGISFSTAIISISIAFIVAFIFYTFCCTNLEEKILETVDWRHSLKDDLDYRLSNTPKFRQRSHSESDLEEDANEIERQKKIGCLCHNKISFEE